MKLRNTFIRRREKRGTIRTERVGETLEVSVGIKFSLENTRIYTLIKIYIFNTHRI